MTEEITAELRAIREKLETISNVDAFRAWARSVGIKPSVDEKCNFWSRADIAKARERGKR